MLLPPEIGVFEIPSMYKCHGTALSKDIRYQILINLIFVTFK